MAVLNVREARFCMAIANTGDKYKAFDIANYQAKNQAAKAAAVSRLLKRPEIKEKITDLTKEIMLAKGVTEERVTANLADIAFNTENSKVDRNRALELLGKTLAMFTDNVNTNDMARQRELDEKASTEAAEIARLRLGAKYGLGGVRAAQTKPEALNEVAADGIGA